jgi:hypothetical protein
MTFGCWSCDHAHRILQGGRWWLPPSSSHGESCESVFAHGSSVHQKCSDYALTNLLFGFCKSVWVIDLLVILPSPYPITPARSSTLKVLQTRECTRTSHFFVMFTLDSHLNLLRNLGVHNYDHHQVVVCLLILLDGV